LQWPITLKGAASFVDVVVVPPVVDVVLNVVVDVEREVEVGVVVVDAGLELVLIANPQPCDGSLSASGSDTND
jgi:hypothetical protein